ncbi:MAG: hypothetical protein ACRDC4_00770 [Plesiomonas sp.]
MAQAPRRVNRAARPARNAIAILPYGPSDSVRDLADAISAAGTTATRLRREGSTFRGRQGELVVNWGNSTIVAQTLQTITGAARLLNSPEAIRRASMKTDAFAAMGAAGVNQVEYTTDRGQAQRWVDEGALVYARTRLQGHSGEGIVMCHRDPQTIDGVGGAFQVVEALPQAPLYTKGITAQRREFRIHVMNGVVTYVQQKKRENNYRENPNYSNVVRNYHTGWIYATSDVQPNDAALAAAVAAVQALGLDFGAVDVITRQNDAWVLEVNTAPGLSGTNLETYTNNFLRIHRGEEPVRWVPRRAQEVEQELEVLAEEAAADENFALPADPVEMPVEEVARERVQARAAEAAIRPAPRANPEVQEAIQELAQQAGAVPADRPRRAPRREEAVAALVDKAYYFATVNEERTVVQYEAGPRVFFMIGFDVPIPVGDVRIISRIEE